MFAFLLREIVQQLTNRNAWRLLRSSLVEPPGLFFHRTNLVSNLFDGQDAIQPNRLSVHKSFHVLPAEQWNVITESLVISLSQSMSMTRFLFAHGFESLGGFWVRRAPSSDQFPIKSTIPFLQTQRPGEQFPPGQNLERLPQ